MFANNIVVKNVKWEADGAKQEIVDTLQKRYKEFIQKMIDWPHLEIANEVSASFIMNHLIMWNALR